MIFELNLRLEWGPQMSHRSEKLARYVRQSLTNQPSANEANVNRNRLLDEGFLRLREDIRREFEAQIDELKREPDCGNSLLCSFSGEKWSVFRIDDKGLSLSIKFDSHERMVSIKSERPTKFSFYIKVDLVNSETDWYYSVGEKKSELSSSKKQVDWIVEKALYALFGVET
jgi:hypothetical protein